MSSDIENLIVKYLNKSATAKDLDTLASWIEKTENKQIFKAYVKVHYYTFYSIKEPDNKELLDKLHYRIKKEKSFVYRLKTNWVYKYTAAAILIGFICTAIMFKNRTINPNRTDTEHIVDQKSIIKPGVDKAVLTLEDGSQVVLENGNTFSKSNMSSNGQEIIYNANTDKQEEVKYNYLTIPRGGQFNIKLSDGTKVWLNSDTQLKYPVMFINGTPRKVELVFGEAYFDVSPSAEHNGSNFIVVNNYQEVEVLGTEFNIKAYLDESKVYTTLVEGKVSVNMNNSVSKYLTPSQQLTFNKETNSNTIRVVDVFDEISWRDGVFSFDNKSLKEMMVVLARWYDVEVIFKNQSIEKEEFVGIMRKNQDIKDILTNIKNFGIIKNYRIYDKTIILE